MTQAERTRAPVAHGGLMRLLGFLGVSVVVHGLLVAALPRESSPRKVPAPRPAAGENAIVWIESPALSPAGPTAPTVGGPALGHAPALAAPSVPRSRVTPIRRAPAAPPAAPRAAPGRAPAASEGKPPLVEPPAASAPLEVAGAPQEEVGQAVAGASAAEPEGTGAASPEGVAEAPGGGGSHGAAVPGGSGTAGSAGAPHLGDYARRLFRAVGQQRRYPAIAARLGMEGTARVQVGVSRDGSLAGAPRLVGSSGHEVLDAEALRMVEAAAPFEPLPEGHARPLAEFVIPVEFSLRTGR